MLAGAIPVAPTDTRTSTGQEPQISTEVALVH
jgi:hypothetical protein